MVQSLWFSIRHHSQKTESVFNLIDITDKNAKNLGFARLVARVIARSKLTNEWQQQRRDAHEPRLKRKAAGDDVVSVDSDGEDEEEAKGGVSKNKKLVHCAREVRMGTNQALSHGKEVYTSAAMKAVRDITRRRRILDPATGKKSYPKKTRQQTVFEEDDQRLDQHWKRHVPALFLFRIRLPLVSFGATLTRNPCS